MAINTLPTKNTLHVKFYSYFLSILLLLSFVSVTAQTKPKYTLSGYVKDDLTKETSIGVSVYVKGTSIGTVTNIDGFFSLTLEAGTYQLMVAYVGYNTIEKTVVVDKNVRVDFEMALKMSKEIEIIGEKKDKNVSSTDVGTVKLDMAEIKKIPAFMGEVDVLKTIQLLPGVKSAGDGNTGFYVRGGGPDQNLILMDGAVVYNAAHLLGFFSVFNGNAVESVNLVKGGMPAEYGGRLSSVLDITMKEGDKKRFKADGGIGVISSRLTVEGPIKKDTSSFVFSARRTYIDAVARPFAKPSSALKSSGYYFYDMNAKVNYRFSKKDVVFLSGYYGRDIFNFKDKKSEFGIDNSWGNTLGVLRWNHVFNDKLFVNSSVMVSDYKFSLAVNQSSFEFKLFSGVRDWSGKVDFSYFPTIRHHVKFGSNYTFHTFTPVSVSAKSGDTNFDFGKVKRDHAHETALYLSDDFELTNRIKIHAGLRYSYFMQVGPFDRYTTDAVNTGQVVDTVHFNKNKKVKDYGGLEPRLNVRFALNNRSSIKASYTYNLQYIHLASLSALTLPMDTWTPSSQLIQPQKGTQYSLGYFHNFDDNKYETSVEGYYKDLRNQIEYKEGSLPSDDVNNNSDNQFTFGKGWAYGTEFFLKKKFGKLNGWLGYTISYTKRQFNDINLGKVYYAKYDRRHDVSIVTNYDLNKKWTFSAVWVYGTGNAITVPVSYYFIDGNFVTEYGERNSFRMPAYHRLDLSATFTPDHKKKMVERETRILKHYAKQGKSTENVQLTKPWRRNYESSWNFSIFNAYNRHNPYIVYFSTSGTLTGGDYKISPKKMYLFPILPSVTWNFKF
jgi:CarboxypepD_reg-like domain/TonB-dependent Receptor Plug Domain